MSEFSTTVELAGEPLAATVIYERCPFDGHPVIYEVILKDAKLEITRALKANFEAEIDAETEAAIADNAIDCAEDRRFFRRAA